MEDQELNLDVEMSVPEVREDLDAQIKHEDQINAEFDLVAVPIEE